MKYSSSQAPHRVWIRDMRFCRHSIHVFFSCRKFVIVVAQKKYGSYATLKHVE